jgi:hypothetical protein
MAAAIVARAGRPAYWKDVQVLGHKVAWYAAMVCNACPNSRHRPKIMPPAGIGGAMAIQLEPGESILQTGRANHFKGIESVGGRLWLTNRRLYFESHPFNIQRHAESYPLGRIVDIKPRRTLGVIPNGISLLLADGKEERFAVWEREQWLTNIHVAARSHLLRR